VPNPDTHASSQDDDEPVLGVMAVLKVDRPSMDPGGLAEPELTDESRSGPGWSPSQADRPQAPGIVKTRTEPDTPIDTPRARSSPTYIDDSFSGFVGMVDNGPQSVITAPPTISRYISPNLLPRISLRTSLGVIEFLVDSGAIASFLTA